MITIATDPGDEMEHIHHRNCLGCGYQRPEADFDDFFDVCHDCLKEKDVPDVWSDLESYLGRV